MEKDHICRPDSTGECWVCYLQKPRDIVVRPNTGIDKDSFPWAIEIPNGLANIRLVTLKTNELITLRDQANKALEETEKTEG